MKRSIAVVVLLFAVETFSACQSPSAATPSPAGASAPPPITLGGITVITEDYPPLNYIEDNVVRGPSVEVVYAIQEKLGTSQTVQVYPWARGYQMATDTVNTALFSTSRTQARETLFQWVGPIAVKRYTLYANKGSGIKLTSLEEAKAYQIGVQLQGVTEQDLKAAGFTTQLQPVTDVASNLSKLRLKRIDLWYADNGTARAVCKQAGISLSEIEPVFVVREGLMYIAFNKETDPSIVAAWQKAYEELYQDGSVEEIFAQYQMDDLYPRIQ